MHRDELLRASARRLWGSVFNCALGALLLVAGCKVDSNADDSDAPIEGGGASVPEDPKGEAHTGEGETSMSQAIITPIHRDAPTLPPTIIFPSTGEAPPPPPPAGCGNGQLEDSEVCDPSLEPCCKADCSEYAAAGTVCRASRGDCDVAETCSGEDGVCPDDAVASDTAVCRTANDACDVVETCDGVGVDCPADAVARSGKLCRSKQGVCDVVERCDGVHNACPDDGFAAANDGACRPAKAGDPCDASEACDGTGPDCPPDGFLQGNVCRPAVAGGCDIAETCAGDSPKCPTDAFEPDGTACHSALGQCSFARCCPGVTTASAAGALCSHASGEEVVFVTSGTTNGAIGVAGADKLCNDAASSANLAGPFHAWISSGAASRVPLTAASRVGPGPYARVDGVVVADGLTELIQGAVRNGISRSEWNEVRNTTVWTGTSATGVGAFDVNGLPLMCSNWTNGTTASGEVGLSVTNKPNWTEDSSRSCDQQLALYCFADKAPDATGLAFVSSGTTYLGDGLAGLADADDLCERSASSAGFKQHFVAWMSDLTTDAHNRIPDRAYFLTDGKRVATSIADLIDGSIENPINVDEEGVPIGVGVDFPLVWTGTDQAGRANHTCNSWMPDLRDLPVDGTQGDPSSTSSSWTDVGTPALCQGPGHVYCFQND